MMPFEEFRKLENRMLVMINVANQAAPMPFKARLFANVVLTMKLTMDKWTPEELEAALQPCGEPGCNCHVALASAIETIRSVTTEGANKYEGMSAVLMIGGMPRKTAEKN